MERLTRRDKVDGNEFVRINKGAPDFVVYEKLAGYEDLDEQKRLIKLPCAVGDTVYTNDSRDWWYLSKEDRPYEVKVDFIGITRAGNDNFINVVFTAGQMSQFKFSDIGKTVFLTREEAEAALKELEKE